MEQLRLGRASVGLYTKPDRQRRRRLTSVVQFHFLGHKGGKQQGVGDLFTSFGKLICCPAAILNSKPDEEFAAGAGGNSSTAQTELCEGRKIVRRFTSIRSRFGELPMMLISHLRL